MTAVRSSVKLTKYNTSLVYEVPTGKFASLSVSFKAPHKTGLCGQLTTISSSLSLAEATGYTPYHPNMGNIACLGGDTTPYKISAIGTSWADSSVAGTPIGFRYAIAAKDPSVPFIELESSSYVTKSLPILDFGASPTLSKGAFWYDGSANRFALSNSTLTAYTTGYNGNSGYTAAATYGNCGGAIYGGSALSLDNNGYSSWWYNNITAASSGLAASANYSSQPSSYSCYEICSSYSLQILPGSLQVMFITGGTPYFWCSAWAAGQLPKMARITYSNVAGGSYNAWDTNSSVIFTGAVNGEKLFWNRHSAGYYYVGSSTGSIYMSNTTSFNTTYTKLTGINADVDVQTPPIRTSDNTLVFRSIAGAGHWVMTGGATPTWSNITDLGGIYGYTETPALSSLISSSGITPIIYSSSLGYRTNHVRLYGGTQYRDVVFGYDLRDPASDIVSNLYKNAEKTQIVITAGTKLYAYTEGENTLVSVYGFEEYA